MRSQNFLTTMIKKFKYFNRFEIDFISTWAARFFFGFTFIAVFVPFNPSMPSTNLDPSWRLGVNHAVSQNLGFGDDIIFTFGPYAAIYTGMYHPNTDKLMMWGSILISISYIMMISTITNPQSPLWLIAFSIFLPLAYTVDDVFLARDPLLFSYPIVLSLLIYQTLLHPVKKHEMKYIKFVLATILIGLFSLGLLPLIKGTMLLMAAIAILLCMLLLMAKGKRWAALIVAVIPAISIPFYWTLAGQPLGELPIYFNNLNQIISEYTDAMSIRGNLMDIPIFWIASFFIALTILIEKPLLTTDRLFLLVLFTTFIFVGHKSGFVRHDKHALLATETLFIAGLFLSLVLKNKSVPFTTFLVCLASFVISINYISSDVQSLYSQVKMVYTDSWRGALLRSTNKNWLSYKFDASLITIRNRLYIPPLQGITDIYSYNQAYLLASENTWSPRPVFQSYAAYNPYLLKLNEKHLRNIDAPDNLLFKIETIDGRFPALDDGLSWPTIINHYCIKGVIGPYIHFQKQPSVSPESLSENQFRPIYSATHYLSESVDLPATKALLLAEISIEPTFWGKFFSFLYKLPEIRMKTTLANNTEKDYRVIPSMMQTSFVISPMIVTTDDFLSLATNNNHLDKSFVTSIEIYPDLSSTSIPDSWIKLLWKPSYTIKLSPVYLHRERIISQCD